MDEELVVGEEERRLLRVLVRELVRRCDDVLPPRGTAEPSEPRCRLEDEEEDAIGSDRTHRTYQMPVVEAQTKSKEWERYLKSQVLWKDLRNVHW